MKAHLYTKPMFTHDSTNGKYPQARCFEDNPTAGFYAALQLGKSNYKYGAFDSALAFASDYISKAFTDTCHINEVIRDTVPVKMFLDVDSTEAVDIQGLLGVLVQHADISGFKLDLRKVLVDTSHGENKRSYHLVIDDRHRFENMSHLRTFMHQIKDELLPFSVDMGVYTKNRLFRLHGSSKYGSTRHMGDVEDVTRTKAGNPNAAYRKFIQARLVTNLDGHKDTISMSVESLDKSTLSPETASTGRGLDVMAEFQHFPQASAWDEAPADIIERDDGVEYKLRRTSPSFCHGCNRTHDNRNGYIFVGNRTGSAFLKCYVSKKSTFLFQVSTPRYEETAECTVTQSDGTEIEAPKVDPTAEEMALDMKNEFSELGRVYVYNQRYCSNYEPLMSSTATIIGSRANMGAGKTNAAAKRVLAMGEDMRNVVISFRLSLTGTYKQKFKGFEAYTDIEGRIDDTHRNLIIQPESMSRMGWSAVKPFKLFADEAHQIRTQLTSSTFMEQPGARASFERFKWLVRYATQIELMDANLTADDVKFFADMRGDDPTVEVFINDNGRFANWTYASCEKGEALVLAMEDINEGKRVYIACNRGVDCTSAIAEMLRGSKLDPVKVLEISSNTINTPEVIAAMADPNKTWGKYQAVVVSPSIQSGVSYDGTDFDNIYGIFGNRTNASGDAAQMLYRVRHPKNKRVVVEVVHNNNNIGSGYPSSIFRGLELRSQHQRADSLKKMTEYELDRRGVASMKKNDFMKLYLHNTASANRDYFHFKDNLRIHHIANGFKIETVTGVDPIDVDETAVALRKMTKLIKRNKAKRVGMAADISQDKVREICKLLKTGKNVAQERVNELKKANILDAYGFGPTSLSALTEDERTDWYLKYGDHKRRSTYRNLSTLALGFEQSIEHVKCKELSTRDDELMDANDPARGLDGNSLLSQLSIYTITSRTVYMKWSTAVGWLIKLGFKGVWDTQMIETDKLMTRARRVRNASGDIKELGHILEKTPRRMKGFLPGASGQEVIRFMNGTLSSMFGLSIKGNRKKEPTEYGLTVRTFAQYEDEDEPHLPWIGDVREPNIHPIDSDDEDSDDEDAVNPFL